MVNSKSDHETERRRDDALRRALNTPPKPHKKPQVPLEFMVLDGRLLVADVKMRNGSSITTDLYRNMNDFRQGTAMERSVKLDDQSSPAM